MFQNVQQIQDFIRQNGIAFLDFKMIDLRGRWKHLSIPAARFNEDIMTHGIGFDGSNYGYAQVERSDMVFLPDITTAVVDPFVKAPTLTMIGDVMSSTIRQTARSTSIRAMSPRAPSPTCRLSASRTR